MLRGINVGGHSIIKMAQLRSLFESFGFTEVATHVQSGNVLFSTNDAGSVYLARHIERKLAASFGRQIAVFVLSLSELKDAAAHNPFEPERRDEEQRCHLMFLSSEPEEGRQKALMALQGEEYRFHVRGRILYYTYSGACDGHRRTVSFERVLGVTGTARNSKVVDRLIELLS